MSTRRHTEKLNGHYLSSAAQYVSTFQETIRRVTRGSPFWEPQRR